jgi:hypothetical protein
LCPDGGTRSARGLKEGDVIPDAQRFLVRHRKRERLRQLLHGPKQSVFPVILRENVLLRGWQEAQPLARGSRHPFRPVETVEEAETDFVLLQHQGDGFLLVDRRPSGSAALGVGRTLGEPRRSGWPGSRETPPAKRSAVDQRRVLFDLSTAW